MILAAVTPPIPVMPDRVYLDLVLGHEGGLFALGAFIGAAAMYLFVTRHVMKNHISLVEQKFEAQISALQKEVEILEEELSRLKPIVKEYMDFLKREAIRKEMKEEQS